MWMRCDIYLFSSNLHTTNTSNSRLAHSARQFLWHKNAWCGNFATTNSIHALLVLVAPAARAGRARAGRAGRAPLTQRALQTMSGAAGNAEEERRAAFYAQPWAGEGAARYLHARLAARRRELEPALAPPAPAPAPHLQRL